VTFLTGLALLNSATGHCQVDCVPFTVTMRELDQRAWSATCGRAAAGLRRQLQGRGLGVSLFQSTHGCDATSLIGLPLIRLVDMLHKEGVQIP
jgi:septum formation protein